MTEPIDLDSRRRATNDGFGELLFTLYQYERGHIVHVPEARLPADRHDTWRTMFDTLWYEADGVFKETGDTADEIILLLAIATNGRVVTYTDNDRLETLEQRFWVQRMLRRVGDEDLPPFKACHDNDNKEPT